MFSFVGDTVLDPFAGTGTTLIAALGADRNAIGVECDPQDMALAKRRIEASVNRYQLIEADQLASV